MDKNKVIGYFLIIFGIYLLIGNPIGSIAIFFITERNISPPPGIEPITISTEDLWRNWWNNLGLITIALSVFGLILILIGINVVKNGRFGFRKGKKEVEKEGFDSSIESKAENGEKKYCIPVPKSYVEDQNLEEGEKYLIS
ncbi:MAG: hypothetical protein P8Y70_09225 [Candidatus Lokiarchaeota archaeon]